MKETIKNIISLLWQDFIHLIHLFDRHSDDESIRAYSKELKKTGIIQIPNFIEPELCDQLREQIEGLVSQHPESVELDNGTRFNYRNAHDKNAPDHGMVDVFYVENSVPAIQSIKQDKLIKILESSSNQQIIPLRANAYVNRGVKNTRGYHIDNAQPVVYKAFVYLTDVHDTSYGAYSFIKGSHHFSPYVYLNLIRNLFIKNNKSTDAPLYNKSNRQVCLSKRGTLILSNQNAIHRGMPQEEGKKRVALIFSFMVKSKLSYIHKAAQKSLAGKKVALQH